MIIYAHRGNLTGRTPARENAPDYIDNAIATGFHVEIDLRMVDGKFFLGHDKAQHPITAQWLRERKHRLLAHIKDHHAIREAQGIGIDLFCHEKDEFTLTRMGFLWLAQTAIVPDKYSIVPLITREQIETYPHRGMYGVCSDFPILANERLG